MSREKLNKKPKQKDLERVFLENKISLKIPKEVLRKIQYLCSVISKVEWSGVLFYSVKNTIQNLDKVELTVEDIYPMDKGTAGGTSYELGEDLIDFRMNNPQSLKWKIGHVHSHHSFDSFFSNTDMSELNDNSKNHNYYLSLIVNNAMEMVARVAFRGEPQGYTVKNEKGENFTLNLEVEDTQEVLFICDCDIKIDEQVSAPDDFKKRVEEIIKKRKAPNFVRMSSEMDFREKIREVSSPKNLKPINETHIVGHDPFEMGWSNIGEEDPSIEEFAVIALRLGYEIEGDDLEQVISDIAISLQNRTMEEYVTDFLESYPETFEQYWGKSTTETFIETTNSFLNLLFEVTEDFNIVEPVIMATTSMLSNLKRIQGRI